MWKMAAVLNGCQCLLRVRGQRGELAGTQRVLHVVLRSTDQLLGPWESRTAS